MLLGAQNTERDAHPYAIPLVTDGESNQSVVTPTKMHGKPERQLITIFNPRMSWNQCLTV